ncbi:hypothetical protein ACJX0J_029510, partial [Zea mays]
KIMVKGANRRYNTTMILPLQQADVILFVALFVCLFIDNIHEKDEPIVNNTFRNNLQDYMNFASCFNKKQSVYSIMIEFNTFNFALKYMSYEVQPPFLLGQTHVIIMVT